MFDGDRCDGEEKLSRAATDAPLETAKVKEPPGPDLSRERHGTEEHSFSHVTRAHTWCVAAHM